MNSKNLLVFIVFMAVIFLVLVPYVKFVVQRQGLDTDLARISLDYSTVGRAKFVERVKRLENPLSGSRMEILPASHLCE